MSFIFFVIFLSLIYPELELTTDFNMFILTSGLIYILTPFQFFSWNAKNVGLSARGFGVMLGHLFIYCITLYLITNDFSYLYFSLIFCYIILLSSQFSYQFILFFTLIASIIFLDVYIFFIPYLSALLFIMTFPNWSKVFFTRQKKYKWMYYSILSKKFGLKLRYSIWRDFIYDSYIVIRKKGFVRGVEYIYRNPIIELFLGFPFIILFFLYVFSPIVNLNTPNNIITTIVFISLCVFIITSFRKTRFLGEPQRYIEFVFPIISIFAAIYSTSITTIIMILGFSVMIIIFELVIIKLMAKRNGKGLTTQDKTLKLLSLIKSSNVYSNNRLISNNFEVLKYFADKDYKIFNVKILEPKTSGLHFDEIFPDQYGPLSIDVMIHFVKSSNIDLIILDTNITSEIEFIESIQNKIKVEHNNSIFNYAIYKVC